MHIAKKLVLTLGAILISGAAHAATVSFTEGNRDDILGSTRVLANGSGPGDTTGTPPGYDLTAVSGALEAGDNINLHGRIIAIEDYYTFTSNKRFSIRFIFDGYTTTAGFNPDSGFTATPLGGNGGSANFFLADVSGGLTFPSAGNSFNTDMTLANGSDDKIFSGFGPGTYQLDVVGLNGFDALYDIRISAVPLPAGGLLLLTALGGLGVARRRRRA